MTYSTNSTLRVAGGDFPAEKAVWTNGSVVRLPQYVGGYRMVNFTFNLTYKPSWWHRFWVRFTLGWEWIDNG